MSQNSNSAKAIILIAVVVALIASGVAGYFFIYKPQQEAKEKARLEQIAKEEAAKQAREQERLNRIKYDTLISQADAFFEQEEWLSAQMPYAEASVLFPNESYPKDQLALIQARLDELEARKAAGIIETISSATGRFYVIVSSSVDDDLAMDYAKKLAQDGVSVRIIEHHANKLPFFGVSLGDYATWDEAMAASESFKSYSDGVWVLKR